MCFDFRVGTGWT